MGIMKRAREEGWRSVHPGGGPPWFLKYPVKPKKVRLDVSKFRKHHNVPVTDGPGFSRVADSQFSSTYPALYEYLCVPPDEMDLSSPTASLTVFSEDGQIKLCLNDRYTGTVCFCAGLTLTEVLQTLDGLLQSGKADWRLSKAKGKKK